ncbi:HlyD family secretion protein, partial [Singulisphaera rosea]
PDVQSFNYIIEPHVPLRTNANEPTPTSGRPPLPPTILGILDEGTQVKAGDVVCELDSSAFRTELQAQQIRCTQAKGWVDQARSILDVEVMSLHEYEGGIFPRDVEAINNYIAICRKNVERAQMTVDWSREAARKNIRSRAQLNADLLTLKQSEFTLREAEGMLERLEKYTGKRISAARRAKIEAIRADKLALESAYQLEKERKERLEKMIAHCTMRAPRDGIVVHANQANLWGKVDAPIQEGITVYPLQPIFRLPNPKQMQVKAEINESKVAQIRSGQPALVRIDAFHDRALQGKVTEITPIPAPPHGPMSDVRVYHATV